MSQDIISDTLNQIMNAKKAGKKEVVMTKHSKLLIEVLNLAKEEGYIENYDISGNKLSIAIGKIIECKAITPLLVEIVIITKTIAGKYTLVYLFIEYESTLNLGFIALHSIIFPIAIDNLFPEIS